MSTLQSVVSLKNVKLFNNTRDDVQVKIGKDTKVKAEYSYYDKDAKYDLRVAPVQTSPTTNRSYIRVSLALGEGESRKYLNGLLNPVKKEGSNFSFAGYLDADDGRIKVMVRKPEEGKSYQLVSFSEDKSAPATAESTAAPTEAETDPF